MVIAMVLETAGEFLMGTTSEFVARPFVSIRLRFFKLFLLPYSRIFFWICFHLLKVDLVQRTLMFVLNVVFEGSSWEAFNGSGYC